MNCEKVRELLSPYLDEMTNEKETYLVKAHLDVCTVCRAELEQIKVVCDMVHELPAPEAPDNFYHDLELRLFNNNFKYFGKKTIKTPKKPGWIAASVAGLALATGIYASSFLPVGGLVANLKDRYDQRKNKSMVAIDEILERSGVSLNKGTVSVQSDKTTDAAQVNDAVLPIERQSKINSGKVAAKTDTTVVKTPLVAELESYTAEVVTSKITVDDLGSSVQQVIHIAAANEGQYEVLPVNDPSPQTLAVSETETKALSIKVDEERSYKVLEQLNNIGRTEPLQSSNIEITEHYNEAVKNINDLQQQIETIKSQKDISETDQARLDELQEQLKKWSTKKSQLENQIRQVTINVYLQEESQP